MKDSYRTKQQLIEELSILKKKIKKLQLSESGRKQAEQALREREEQYRTLVENASDIIFRTDNSGHFTFVNPAALSITKYEEEEVIGMHYPALIRPDMRDEAIKFFGRQFLKGVQNTYSEHPIITKDGHEVWLGQNTQLIMEDGNVTCFQSVARDITARKRAEEAMQQSEERYRSLVENANEAILVIQDGMIKFLNNRAVASFGYSEQELMFINIFELIHPEDRDLVMERYLQKINGDKTSTRQTYRTINKSGQNQWVEISSVLIDWEGKPATLNLITDITERKQTTEALRESETKLQAIFDTVGTGILIIDRDTQIIIEANQRAVEMTGLSRERMIGQICNNLVCPAQADRCPVKDLGQSVDNSERKLLHSDGSQKDILKTVYPMVINGRDYYLESFIDITERNRLNEVLKKRETQLNEMGRMAKVGGWEFDVESQKQVWTEEVYHIHEVDESYEPTVSKGIEFYAPESRPVIERAVQRSIEYGEPFDVELEIITTKGNHRWVHANGHVQQENGKTKKVFGTFQDITERKQADEKIWRMAYHDSLTGLPNRKLFSDRLSIALAQAQRNQKKVGIAMLDLDNFKGVNDTLGHDVGDLLLKGVTERRYKLVR